MMAAISVTRTERVVRYTPLIPARVELIMASEPAVSGLLLAGARSSGGHCAGGRSSFSRPVFPLSWSSDRGQVSAGELFMTVSLRTKGCTHHARWRRPGGRARRGQRSPAVRYHHHLAALCSAIDYPVFVNGRNYSGASPPLARHPVLRSLVRVSLGARLAMTTGALVVPLGKAAQAAVSLLAADGLVDPGRLLEMPRIARARLPALAWSSHCKSSMRSATGSDSHSCFSRPRTATSTARASASPPAGSARRQGNR